MSDHDWIYREPSVVDLKRVPRLVEPQVLQFLYFIRCGERGPIKIGIADNPGARMAGLQVAHFLELRLMGTIAGGAEAEKAWHARFAKARIRGEWFEPTAELLAAIDAALLGEG